MGNKSSSRSSKKQQTQASGSAAPPPPYTPGDASSTYGQDAKAQTSSSATPARETNPFRAILSTTTGTGPAKSDPSENQLELLRKFDTICLVDDSSSMQGTRWSEAREALAGIANIASQYDADGIEIHFLNSPLVGKSMRNAVQVKSLFDSISPSGMTPTGAKLEELLLDYLRRLETARNAADAGDAQAMKQIKPVNFIVITDGAATDDPEPVILQAASRLDARCFPLTQVGIQFVQIGNDPGAAEALRQLDDSLKSGVRVRDIVDTVSFKQVGGALTADFLTKSLLGAINRRIDGKGTS